MLRGRHRRPALFFSPGGGTMVATTMIANGGRPQVLSPRRVFRYDDQQQFCPRVKSSKRYRR